MTKKDAIIEAATRLFAVKGFNETSTSEVAKEAGVAQGTLFYHFKTKEGIMLEAFHGIMKTYQDGLEKAAKQARTGLDALEGILRFHFAFTEKNSTRFLVVLRDFPFYFAHSDPGNRDQVRERILRTVGLLRETLERGCSDGSIRDVPVEETAHVLRGLMHGLVRQKLLGPLTIPVGAEDVIAFCRQALARES
ncbi:MAG: TetR/AcrR family transcriptional regulator [Deltaproteobacteria bacterium]